MTKPPKLDGRIDPAEWARSVGFDGFAFRNNLDRRRVRAWVAATSTHLYFAIQSQLPEEGPILARMQKETVKVVYDDSIEVWIDPTPGSQHGQTFQMLANAIGRIGYKHHARGRVQEKPTWRGNWKVANGFHRGYWHCEVEVPIDNLPQVPNLREVKRTADQGAWGINLCRNWKQPWGFSSTGGGAYAPSDRFTFATDDALAIRHESRADAFVGDLHHALVLHNPTKAPLTVRAEMTIKRDVMPALRRSEALTVGPGRKKELFIKTKDEATKRFQLALRVASPDGKTVYYERSCAWQRGKPWRWTTKKKKVLPIDFQFAYYPYLKTMRVLIDTSNLPENAAVDEITCTVREKRTKKPIKTITLTPSAIVVPDEPEVRMECNMRKIQQLGMERWQEAYMLAAQELLADPSALLRLKTDKERRDLLRRLPLLTPGGSFVPLGDLVAIKEQHSTEETKSEGERREAAFTLPPLKGEYEIAVRAKGKGVPTGELVKEFERTLYEWEHKGLGTSTKVYPPFTPIEVKDGTLSTVLREHKLNDLGLWDQVVARGKPLLAGPMRLVAEIDGARVAMKASQFAFSKKRAHKAVAHSILAAGPLSGRALCQWDYDGMMRVDLLLSPTQEGSVDAFRLEIPLKDEMAPMIHAMGDGIRNSVYIRVPKGEGVVWDSSKVQVNDFPRNFCSYIYVGSPVRGLCWFAENDRDWAWDPAKPNLDLVRRGDQLILRVHFINQPTTLAEPRIITFGLQAAPVKPRIGNWRYIWKRENYTLLGTDINWLARGNCGSVYPAGKDMYLWKMIKRGNREKLSNGEIQKVIDHGRKYFEPYGPARVESYERHVRHNLRSRYGRKMVFYYNRASFQLADEFQTFQDEWCLTDYRTVGRGRGIGEIKIVPTASYIDHALWWYGKSFDIAGNQGVYWDNYFFRASYNTLMTGAYKRPDGSIMPSTGIWGLRELVKRTFQYMNERGMRPITMAHMTSTGILPLYSFCTVQYDWEWKYSQGDFQYRFPREYILLVTTGELAGTWPVLLGDHGKLARDEWTQRTFAGVCLVHELDGWGGGKAWRSLFQHVHRLAETPGLEVYRYWDDRPQPIVADHPDLPTIVYSLKGKEALLGVTSYSEKDLQATITIDPKLLGFTGGYRVLDAETGKPVAVEDNTLKLAIKKHDVREFRILP